MEKENYFLPNFHGTLRAYKKACEKKEKHVGFLESF